MPRHTPQMPSRWMSLNEVCQFTSLSRTTINTFRADPSSGFPVPLEATDGARRVCFIRSEIEAWMAERERKRPSRDRLGANAPGDQPLVGQAA